MDHHDLNQQHVMQCYASAWLSPLVEFLLVVDKIAL